MIDRASKMSAKGPWPKSDLRSTSLRAAKTHGAEAKCEDCPDSGYSRPSAGNNRTRAVPDRPEIATLDPLTELLRASGAGDSAAFARVYQLSAPRLYPIALRLLRRREAAEEILQEAYVLIWRKAAQYDPGRGRPLTWMAAVVRNRAIDRLRAEKREPRNPVEWDEAAEVLADPMSAAPMESLPDTVAVRQCLKGLQDNQRAAILLAYYYGMTHEELSARLAAPLGTVKSWVRRGLLQLKGCLET